MHIIWKIILALVGLFVAVTLLGFWGPRVASYWREYKYGVDLREAEDMARAIETAYKNDLDGGKTPEETFDLFLTALKAGNTLQASKYYELSVQPKALASLQKALAENTLDLVNKNFLNIKMTGTMVCFKNYSDVEGCSIETPENGPSIEFEINSNSGIWKIIRPF